MSMKIKNLFIQPLLKCFAMSSILVPTYVSASLFSSAEVTKAVEDLGEKIAQVEETISLVKSLSDLDLKLDMSRMFSEICTSSFGDPEIANACETYSTLYVSSLAPEVIAGLKTDEESNARNVNSLVSLSAISNVTEYASQTFSEIAQSGGLISSDSKFENALEEIVQGSYSKDYLAGLTDSEKADLYESEWDSLRNLVDLSGVGGSTAAESSIALGSTRLVEEEVRIPHFVDLERCAKRHTSGGLCYTSTTFRGGHTTLRLRGLRAGEYPERGTWTELPDGRQRYSWFTFSTRLVEEAYTYDYNPDLDASLSTTERTATHTAGASTYDPKRDRMNTLEVIGGTMDAALSCMKWELRGICIWLKWSFTGPKIKTVLKVRNYVPELTFQTYSDAGKPPWREASSLISLVGMDNNGFITRGLTSLMGASGAYKNTGGGSSEKQKTSSSRNESNFKLVDAFGNPSAEAFNLLSEATLGLFCPPNTNMFVPHYISNLDLVNWRQYFGVEFWNFRSWVLGSYMLGEYSDNNHYGSIYPRIGFNNAEDEIKSAVLSTYRAAHFITRRSSLRVVNDIYISHKDGLWVSNELKEGDRSTGRFQQLMPHKDRSCKTFPLEKVPDGKRRGETGATMWNFWRRVECCKRPFGKLIFKT